MNYININDINTYPKAFLNFCQRNKEILKSTVTEGFQIDFQSNLAQSIFSIIKHSNIIAIHANRIYDIENIYKKGLLIPSKSKKLIDIILNPIYNKMNEGIYRKYVIN